MISPQHFIQRERGDYDCGDLEGLPARSGSRPTRRSATWAAPRYYGNQWATYLYANDTWRLQANLTVNLGVRWERTTVPLGMTLQKLNAISDVPGLITFGAPKHLQQRFAPRIGIAYSPGTSGSTSIRAGFGMAYDVIFDNVGSTAYPPQLSSTYDAGNFPTIFPQPGLSWPTAASGRGAWPAAAT